MSHLSPKDSDQHQLPPGPLITSGGKIISPGNRLVDVIFVFDTTGSMSDKIHALIQTCVRFVDEPQRYRLAPSFALISFGDLTIPGDRIDLTVALTDDMERIRRGLQEIPRNGGGGNEGESSLDAIVFALQQQYRPNSIKVMILITDEPALENNYRATQVSKMIQQNEMLLYGLTPDITYFREMITANGGEWRKITASSSLDSLLSFFQKLANDVAIRVDDVYRLTGGDVPKYILQLKSGKR